MNEQEFKKLLTESKLPIAVTFSASWCGPCRNFAPIWERAKAKATNIMIIKIDVDECESICQQFSIHGVPTTIVFRNGAEVIRRSGSFPDENTFLEWVKSCQ